MKHWMAQIDGVSRRSFLHAAAKSFLGVSLVPALGPLAGVANGAEAAGGKAKNIIYLFMNGGMTHLDTFDLKPGSEVKGETKPITTNVTGMHLSEPLPTLASKMEHIAIVNSMFTETGAHEPGRYFMRTSYKEIATTRHPCMGVWAEKILGRRNKDLPDSVVINGEARHPAAGFMEPSLSPLPVGNPNEGLKNTKMPDYVTDEAFQRRLEMAAKFDRAFHKKYNTLPVQAYDDYYAQAARLLNSEGLKNFDLNEEEAEVRDAYGRGTFGQGCLLARRLVESGVRYVEIDYGGWDMHNEIATAIENRGTEFDTGLGQLMTELEERDMLKETVIVVATEFGRTPRINQNAGRDHHPGVFSCMLAGAGIKGGQFYGKSDKDGQSVEENGVAVADFNATIATTLGLPLKKEFFSPAGRPFKVAHDGAPIADLLS